MKNPRLVAFEALYSILSDNAYSNLTIDKMLSDVDKKDRGLVSNLVYGVIERKLTLEYIINQYLDGKTKPKVKILLMLGAYQLYFMDKIPVSASINESVELSKQVGVAYYSKLINAVLHKINENKIDIDNIEDISIRYSCPNHLIRMWQKAYCEDNTNEILESINCKAPVFAIPNRMIVDEEELSYELLCENIDNDVYDDVVMITSSFDLHSSNAFKNGLFYIEDYSSYLCAKAVDAQPGDTVIDVCSAPGGKAFTLANCMHNEGKLVACDIHEHRVGLIAKSSERLDLSVIEPIVNDATQYNHNLPIADKILCDVPCSGFGIIRRKPEIRYKELDSVKELPDIQLEILTVSARYLKAGGTIVYSTCTLNKKENEKVVEAFLNNNKNYELVEQKTTFPTKDGGDGFFWAKIKKND